MPTNKEQGIRRFRASDAREIAEIAAASPGAAEWPVESYGRLVGAAEYVALVQETEGPISGFIVGRQAAGEAEVMNLAVRPEQRKRGIGGQLLTEILNEFERAGVTRVYLEVRESNARARAFYCKRGFTETGKRAKYYQSPEEAGVLMRKQLGRPFPSCVRSRTQA